MVTLCFTLINDKAKPIPSTKLSELEMVILSQIHGMIKQLIEVTPLLLLVSLIDL